MTPADALSAGTSTPDAPVDDIALAGSDRLAVYFDVFGAWRWEYCDPEGEIRDSASCFDSRDDCLRDARSHGLVKASPGGGA